MSKVNYDAKRAQILKQIHADRVKAAEKAKKDAALDAKIAAKLETAVELTDQVEAPATQAA